MNSRYKAKSKKSPSNTKPKSAKKHKSDGPTCSMFLADITRKLAFKKKQEEEKEAHKSIVQTIIDSVTNALPVRFLKRSPLKVPSPMQIETLQAFAPELLPNDIVDIPSVTTHKNEENEDIFPMEEETKSHKPNTFKMPKMPLVNSDVFKKAIQERKLKEPMQDQAVNTGSDNDVASSLAKHVNTLRKISLIAEEFNQKTAKNLKEIVDSVQDDLIKKLEAIQTEKLALSDKGVHIEDEPRHE